MKRVRRNCSQIMTLALIKYLPTYLARETLKPAKTKSKSKRTFPRILSCKKFSATFSPITLPDF